MGSGAIEIFWWILTAYLAPGICAALTGHLKGAFKELHQFANTRVKYFSVVWEMKLRHGPAMVLRWRYRGDLSEIQV